LDTNVLIHGQRGTPEAVRERLRASSPEDLAISAVTVAELWYGAARSKDPERKRRLWAQLLGPYEILPFDRAAGEFHGSVRFQLVRRHRLAADVHHGALEPPVHAREPVGTWWRQTISSSRRLLVPSLRRTWWTYGSALHAPEPVVGALVDAQSEDGSPGETVTPVSQQLEPRRPLHVHERDVGAGIVQ
jgi:predicted nucleic acid-binding protein